jgi:hypothetical protein
MFKLFGLNKLLVVVFAYIVDVYNVSTPNYKNNVYYAIMSKTDDND